MSYEFYIDQFLAEHFLTGFLLLQLSAVLQKKEVSLIRIAAGSLCNSATSAFCICTGMPFGSLAGILVGGAVVCWKRSFREFLQEITVLFLVTLGFGGVLEILLTLFHLPLMAGVVLAVIILRMAAAWNGKQKMKRNIIVPVKLQWGEQTEEFSGMIDTGNHLQEPLTGRPVSILDGTAAEKLLGQDWEQRKGYCLIPYHSIGTKQGWMKGVTADCMWVKVQGRDLVFRNPVLAVCEGAVSAGTEYQVILHPLHAAVS